MKNDAAFTRLLWFVALRSPFFLLCNFDKECFGISYIGVGVQ
jgi:hypothetical protein